MTVTGRWEPLILGELDFLEDFPIHSGEGGDWLWGVRQSYDVAFSSDKMYPPLKAPFVAFYLYVDMYWIIECYTELIWKHVSPHSYVIRAGLKLQVVCGKKIG